LSARAARRVSGPRARAGGRAPDPLAPLRRAFERHLRVTLVRRLRAPGVLGRAIRYAALSPGKRLRPLLALATCEAVGGDWRRALPAAVAVECVHAFSLVHDDLPALDDDDVRRGRPTTHRKFGEATAILAGDALLAFAFEELAQLAGEGVPAPRVVEAIVRLAYSSGGERLVGGQALDLAAEGRRVTARQVESIHANKTGALMGAAMGLGAIAGGGSIGVATRFQLAGSLLGEAFQIQDDLLNAGSTTRRLGKRAGSDAARGKATYPRAAGEAASRAAVAVRLAYVTALVRADTRRPRRLLALLGTIAGRDR